MSIAKLYKTHILVPKSKLVDVADKLQHLGVMHINIYDRQQELKKLFSPSEIALLKESLEFLEATPVKRRSLYTVNLEPHELVDEILKVKEELKLVQDDIINLEGRRQKLLIWGDFNHMSKQDLYGYELKFYRIKKKELRLIDDNQIYQVVNEDNTHFYVVFVINSVNDICIVGKELNVPEKSISDIESELNILFDKEERIKDKRRFYTKYIKFLKSQISIFEDHSQLVDVVNSADSKGEFYILTGFVEEKLNIKVTGFAAKNKLGIIYHEPRSEDKTPTLIKTSKTFGAGQLLTEFYQTPGYNTIDPSLTVFFSFALFFAIITSDAGYGFVLLLISLYSTANLRQSESGKMLSTLFFMISFATISYGMLIGSYFGFPPPENTILSNIKIIDVNDFNFMMGFSIAIGMIHIFLASMLVTFFGNDREQKIISFSYALIIIAITLYIVKEFNFSLITAGLAILNLFLFAVKAKDTKIMNKVLARVMGLFSLSKITSLFGDVMSYMRLFALGLAGASLAGTFNKLANNVLEAAPSVGIIAATLLLLFGHSLNFLLAMMSGVVHGLRLNYIEFFNWGVSEEGIKFQYFKKGEK